MEPFPHRYSVTAVALPTGHLSHPGDLPPLLCDAPTQFGGPGSEWSPEDLLTAAVADCFILTFRAIARASKFEWTSLDCRAEGTLDRPDRTIRFTGFEIHASLTVPVDADVERGERLLQKAEENCLVTNSMVDVERHLHTTITSA